MGENRGGKRPGAGRNAGEKDLATPDQRQRISELSKEMTPLALQTLGFVARHGRSESARVAAATAILDRGYGRPRQAVEHSGPDGEAIQIEEFEACANNFASRMARLVARCGPAEASSEHN